MLCTNMFCNGEHNYSLCRKDIIFKTYATGWRWCWLQVAGYCLPVVDMTNTKRFEGRFKNIFSADIQCCYHIITSSKLLLLICRWKRARLKVGVNNIREIHIIHPPTDKRMSFRRNAAILLHLLCSSILSFIVFGAR